MAEKIKLVQGDTKPVIEVYLNDENSGEPIGLSGATVRMYFRALGETTILTTVLGTLLPGRLLPDGTKDATPPYDTAGTGGHVQFAWAPGDLDQPAGAYEGEIEITFDPGGPTEAKQTVYTPLRFRIREDF